MTTQTRPLLKETKTEIQSFIQSQNTENHDTFHTTIPGTRIEVSTHKRYHSIDGESLTVAMKIAIENPFDHTPANMLGCPHKISDVSEHFADLESELTTIMDKLGIGVVGGEFRYRSGESSPEKATYVYSEPV